MCFFQIFFQGFSLGFGYFFQVFLVPLGVFSGFDFFQVPFIFFQVSGAPAGEK
jgi:hypothetical protein